MDRHEFLAGLHELLVPRSYLEIGVNQGRSLALSRTRTIGVDPAFRVNVDLACDLQLVRATSDDFFARPDPIAWFPDGVVDLAFIDGMHIFEYALRDFMNTELLTTAAGVVVLDDMLPRTVEEAARDRLTKAWAGDVYKVATVLERYRPDLVVLGVDTDPTGVVVVAGLDPADRTLRDRYDEILAEYATPDPQQVPDDILLRRRAADPQQVLACPLWRDLAAARAQGRRPQSLDALRALQGSAHYVPNPPSTQPWPTRAGGRPRKTAAKKVAAKKAAKNVAKKTAKKAAAPRRRALRTAMTRLRSGR